MSAHGETSCPEVVLSSIAWYPDELDEARRGMVEAHLAQCLDCREELAFVRGEAEPPLADAELPDADAVYARVMQRIERAEARGGQRRSPRRAPRRRAGGARVARGSALAAGLVLALLLGGVGGLWLATPSEPGYRPASGPAPSDAGGAADAALDVVFRADASAGSIHAALRAIGGEIVSGPTGVGVYRVRLSEGADLRAAAAELRGEGHDVATFAEPAAP